MLCLILCVNSHHFTPVWLGCCEPVIYMQRTNPENLHEVNTYLGLTHQYKRKDLPCMVLDTVDQQHSK